MIFRLLVIHNLDRISSTNRRVLHTTTWNYFTSRLFSRSPEVVKEAIMTDINEFVQEFWKNSRVFFSPVRSSCLLQWNLPSVIY